MYHVHTLEDPACIPIVFVIVDVPFQFSVLPRKGTYTIQSQKFGFVVCESVVRIFRYTTCAVHYIT
jgi:hypothetical protein